MFFKPPSLEHILFVMDNLETVKLVDIFAKEQPIFSGFLVKETHLKEELTEVRNTRYLKFSLVIYFYLFLFFKNLYIKKV